MPEIPDPILVDTQQRPGTWTEMERDIYEMRNYTAAAVPVVLDREFSTSIGTSWTAALTHAVPAGAMGTNRTLRFTLSGYYRNWIGAS